MRVVVTGTGAVSAVGLSVDEAWQSMMSCRSGPITLFDPEGLPVRFAGEVRGFDPTSIMPVKQARRTDRITHLALTACEEALADSGLNVNPSIAHETGVIVGVGMGGIATYSRELAALAAGGFRTVSPFLIPSVTTDAPAVQIALRTGARGPNLAVSSACATGADAIGQAFETIRRGHARVMITGGSEAAVTPVGLAAFARMGALSTRNSDPEGACRPFDADRDGFVIAEGAAVMILEDLDHAIARGAAPLAEVVSYAATSDADHLAAPDEHGRGAARCIELALQRAGVTAGDVSWVNAHGTGTPSGDPAEARAIHLALAEHGATVPVSATKSLTGHLLGAAGAFEAVISVRAIQEGMLPPTANLQRRDPECDIRVVREPTPAELDVVVSSSFGFGGHNSVLVLRPAQIGIS